MPQPRSETPKPHAAKVIHMCFSLGSDDLTSVDDFTTGIKDAVRNSYGDRVMSTILYGEYQHDGKRYKQKDWEDWDGNPASWPKDRYTDEPRAVALHPSATKEYRGPLTTADVRKALDDHREALGQRPKPITPDAPERPVESLSGPPVGWARVPGWEWNPWEEEGQKRRIIVRRK